MNVQFFASSNPAVPRSARTRGKSKSSEIQADCSGLITKGASPIWLPERMDTTGAGGKYLNWYSSSLSAKGEKKSGVEINYEHLECCWELCKAFQCVSSRLLDIFLCWERFQSTRFLKTFDGKQGGLCLLLFRDCCVVIQKYLCSFGFTICEHKVPVRKTSILFLC